MRRLTTSDNTVFNVETQEQIDAIKKHCSENDVKLFDESGNEIELKKKK